MCQGFKAVFFFKAFFVQIQYKDSKRKDSKVVLKVMLEIDLNTHIHTRTHIHSHTYNPTHCRWDHLEPRRAWQPQFLWTLIFSGKCFRENPFTNPGMSLLWISGSDISPMWMSPWLNRLKSASSALHSMYYSPLICQVKAVWVIYNSFCSLAEARSDLFG